ncbi:ABC transporter ATP-binding protein [Haematobacter massiliensis]|uniref:Branched-chain amino acid ABC transporter ATP-binding protein n=1 Tax=Haematobacter massiliensis TaxID=195105 RepID=A0A086YCP0_9RHOB|nr:ABC transporter ATP-binding protein [Haematobacter massiliensis]KFI32040.1 branched-chain amino acid ABC transporter ATP-binding protein [Haematobacter massiliensis]OWJ72643.1 ABC transporter ATP-binding protein [Haematobacter massiliensis]OWJ86782.1 ABC transporter ATP-binding protein [Haematobacter massiliensis]QBJ24426.1 ABC transporter ATP-binding protein [Haematobacter massiliensis]
MPGLVLENVEVIYDKVFLAIKGVSLEVGEGEVVALLGSNGAGKSTTLKAISGLLGPERGLVTRGTIRFGERDLLKMGPPERVADGLVHVLEGRRIFGHLTPDENLIAAYRGGNSARYNELREQVYEYFPRLKERIRSKAGYLSGGEQQMLAIGRALMTEPKLVMLDEPSLGLSPLLVQEIFAIIRKINEEQGLSVLLVEQNAAATLDVVGRAYLIENGQVVMSGAAEVLKSNPDVQDFYLGGAGKVDYRNVKHYRRRKRWLA